MTSGPVRGSAYDPATQPMPVPLARIVKLGMLGWALALIAILLVPGWRDGDRSWWPWACVVGLALGVAGLSYARRRDYSSAEPTHEPPGPVG